MGHLVSPMDAGGYDERFKKWRYDDLPILPEPFRYVLVPGKEDTCLLYTSSRAIWACMGYTVLLCFALFKTGSLSKSLFGAH